MMDKSKKFTIDITRLRLGDAQDFVVLQDHIACSGKGRFVSGRFDSGIKNNEWSRLRLEVKASDYCEYKISVFASNSGEKPSALDWENEKACCRAENLPELLLGNIAGRYLWFCLEVQGNACLFGGSLYTFGEAFEDYLPQIYSLGRESFSHRYLSIFFTAVSELRENIDGLGDNLDAQNAPDEFLPFIARWLGLGSLCGLLSPQELRVFLSYGRYLSRYRGTRRVILLIAELLTGKKPILLEQIKIHENTAPPYAKTYSRLYGDGNRFVFLIFFDFLDSNACMRLQRLTDIFMPVGNASRLVVKPNSVVLDGYTYLDYNARFITESGGSASGVKADEGYVLL